jgi:hypothetical protein
MGRNAVNRPSPQNAVGRKRDGWRVVPTAALCGGLSERLADQFVHALVLEERRHATIGHEHGYATSQNERLGMIDLETVAVNERDREWPKWYAALERA